MSQDYKDKYMKYKMKYIDLKSRQEIGGGLFSSAKNAATTVAQVAKQEVKAVAKDISQNVKKEVINTANDVGQNVKKEVINTVKDNIILPINNLQ